MTARQDSKVAVFACALGTAIEFFDFTLYGALSSFVSTHFFPVDTQLRSLLFTLAIFSVGFIGRPIGALLIGCIGDIKGRKVALSLSIFLMGLSTIGIGILPSYTLIGFAAPILLLILRITQGISVGGELASSNVFLIERFSNRKNFLSGLLVSASLIGALLGLLIGAFIAKATGDILWRIPFIMGGILSFYSFHLRKRLQEPYQDSTETRKKDLGFFLIKRVLTHYRREFFVSICVSGYAGAIAYCVISFVNIYLGLCSRLSLSAALFINSVGLIFFIISSALIGYFSPPNKEDTILRITAVGTILLSIPIFSGLKSGNTILILFSLFVLGSISGAAGSVLFPFISKLFPSEVRCSGVFFSHSIGLAFLGGTFPFFSVYLIEKSGYFLIPGFYLLFLALISFFALSGKLFKFPTS